MDHEPQPVLGRYRFVRRLAAGPRTVVWVAHDEETGRDVVASLLPATRTTGLEPILGMSHPHMAQIIDVIAEWDPAEVPGGEIPHPDGGIVVADHVTGRTLHQRAQGGAVDLVKAVQWIERSADVLATVHRLGGVHGAVSPRSILVAQTTHGVAPVLAHLVAAPVGAYCSPERVTGGGPSEADDVWALCATLYLAVTGKAPFSGANRKDLAKSILAAAPPTPEGLDQDLLDLLGRGLRRSLTTRLHTADEFHRYLLAWLDARDVEHRESVITVMPPANESDRPSTVDDRAMQEAIARPDAPEASLPTSDAPPSTPSPMTTGDADDMPIQESDGERPEVKDAGAAVGPAALVDAEPPSHDFTAAPEDRSAVAGLGPTSPTPPAAVPSEGARGDSIRPGSGRPDATKRSSGAKLALLAAAVGGAALLYFGARSASPPTATDLSSPRAGPGGSGAAGRSARSEGKTGPAPRGTGSGQSASSSPLVDGGTDGGASGIGVPVPGADAPPSECVVSSLPEGTFERTPSLDYVCDRTDYWYISRRTFSVIAKDGRGSGMREWVHLARYELPAVAMLRSRCCPDAEPAKAATPNTDCGSLTDILRDIGQTPTNANIARFEETFECLKARQVRYPPAWDRLPASQSRQHFDSFRKRLKD